MLIYNFTRRTVYVFLDQRPFSTDFLFLHNSYGGECLACTSRREAIRREKTMSFFRLCLFNYCRVCFVFFLLFSSVNDDVPIYPGIWKSATIRKCNCLCDVSILFSEQVVYVAYSTVNNKRNRLHLESTTAVEWGGGWLR